MSYLASFQDQDFQVFSRKQGNGIKLGLEAPVFGYRDLLGSIIVKNTGASAPTFTTYRGSISQYAFAVATLQEAWFEFHMPHDYVPGTEIYIHTHWSQITVDVVTNQAAWNFDITYADGYGTPGGAADPFVAAKTITKTQLISTTQYGHMIAEVVITGATDTATTFDRTKPKVDGLFLVRVYRNQGINGDTLAQIPFLHYVDLHYQTNGIMGTYNKNTPFYS